MIYIKFYNGGNKMGLVFFFIVAIVLLFDGHVVRNQNNELKTQNEEILAKLDTLLKDKKCNKCGS